MIPYHTIPHHTIPYHTIPHRTTPCHAMPYPTVPYCTLWYHHTIPYRTIPYRTIPYRTIPYHTKWYHTTPHHAMPYPTVPYCTIWCNNAMPFDVMRCDMIQWWLQLRQKKTRFHRNGSSPAQPSLYLPNVPITTEKLKRKYSRSEEILPDISDIFFSSASHEKAVLLLCELLDQLFILSTAVLRYSSPSVNPFTPKFEKYILPTFYRELHMWRNENLVV